MNLVIVESPAKAKTIEKYLGKDFKVIASFGHVRDLPPKELGVDVANNYELTYEIPAKAKKVISEIKRLGQNSDIIYLATDLDREGEAISWHVATAIGLIDKNNKAKSANFYRITFNEITKEALQSAIKHPRSLDMNLVDAQQARRVLDRLVGYKLSPLLWKKVKSGLSAGRVQSVAVRLVVEREREIEAFKPIEYWALGALLSKQKDDFVFKAMLTETPDGPVAKMGVKTAKDAEKIVKDLDKAEYIVRSVDRKDLLRNPSAPFTTSTLQMEASRKLGFSAKQTMSVAQKLYEAGHITYMRTDSVNLSGGAVKEIRSQIVKLYGEKYLPEKGNVYATKTKRAQEAHEAIRPTHFTLGEVSTDNREQRLYELIWKRTMASQMSPARFELIEAKIEANKYILAAKGETLKFDGFIKVYTEGKDEESEEESSTIPKLEVKELLDFHELIKDQKFTEPPKRYTEAMLVKKLESLGIGRPSTYAPTMSTIQDRGYVTLEEKLFHPTEIALIVNDLLVDHFPQVVDYKFTADMEDEFDDVAEGKINWVKSIDDFYKPFAENLKIKGKELEKKDFIEPEMTKEKCPDCGEPMMIRLGRYGKFMACSGYPTCKYSRPLESKEDKKAKVVGADGELEKLSEAEGEKCEKCGSKMILKEGRFGKFLACENYPKCKNTKSIIAPTGMKCPDCNDGDVVERRTKRGKRFWGCSKYPGCKYASWTNPAEPQGDKSMDGEQAESADGKD